MNSPETTSSLIIIATIASTIVVALSQIITNITPLIKEYFTTKKAKTSEILQSNVDTSFEIRALLQKLLDIDEKSDRVTLWELSNGESIFRQLHMWKLRFFDEVSRKSVLETRALHLNQQLHALHFAEIIKVLEKEDVAFIPDVIDIDNKVARLILTGAGTKSLHAAFITDVNHQPIGMITVESVHEYIDTKNTVLSKEITEIAIRLAAKL